MGRPDGGMNVEADSLVALLRVRSAEDPAAEVFSFLPEGDPGGEIDWTRGELDRRAREIAASLQARGLAGERALLLYPPGLDFIAAFFGCLYARAIAVPAYPPRPNRSMTRLMTMVEDARPAVVLSVEALRNDEARWSEGIPGLAGIEVLYTDAIDDGLAARWTDPGATPETLAFLQYTSGSTAAPKGVMITHGNLLANSARIQAVFGSVPGARGVFWLPLFHDMGLIGGVLQTLHCGGASTLMPPAAFLQRPLRWLQAISRTGATISGAPNFAYDLCVERTTPEQRAALDLSRWQVAFNGAEPVRAETLDRFAEAFAPAGFRPEAFLPCYGLAEATLLVSGRPAGRRPVIVSVDAAALGRGQIVASTDVANAARLVASGPPAEGHAVAIVDPATDRPLPDGEVGEIWFAGPSVAQGYWDRSDEGRRVMDARLDGDDRRFLRTGDLGFLRDGELFVTGRIKDLIILQGRNIYPQDVEWAAGRSHPALRAAGAAAFAIEMGGRERLAIVLETERRVRRDAADEILAAVRRGVAEALEAEVAAIRLIKPTTLPRTSSGKVRRHACREAFLDGTLEAVAEWTRGEEAGPPVSQILAEPAQSPPVEPSAPTRSRGEIAAWLAGRVAAPLGIRPDEVEIRAPLAGFGIGSLQAVRLAGELEEWLGRKLSPTLVYDHPTIDAMARFLSGESPDVAVAPASRPSWSGGREPIAIVGIGCRFPGAAGPRAFWDLLRRGDEAIGEVPDARWTEQDLLGVDFPRRAGFLRDIDLFDAAFFGITPREAMFLDPQQRMLLEVAWEALEDGGQSPDRLAGSPVGVFIGISTNDYAFIQVKQGGAAIGHRVTGNSGCIAANRISHFFDFRGPSLAIDTACSSSLVAALQACRSLWEGESELAIAGGANLLLQTQVFASFARGGFLSPDGHCRAFDAGANGYVRGEGVGIVVLKPLSRALADGDPIYAVIRGGAVNQDGRTNGLTAPSGPAQEAVLRAAYRHAGIAPGEVAYIEAHGTGTPLGDPIELAALGAVLAEGRGTGRRCAIGSAKTNIGHLEAAAGVAGLIKAALSLHRREIPATLHFSRPNPHVDLEALPLSIAAGHSAWPDGPGPARAGVSSFGFGGTNAHLVLEEGPRCPGVVNGGIPRGRGGEDVVIPLSARTSDALAESCRVFRDFLVGAGDDLDLLDVAHSAGARRAHFEHRLALVAADRDEAVGALSALLRGEPHVGVLAGRRRPGLVKAPVFVFTDGRGIQTTAVRVLFRREPAFRAAIERCEPHLTRELGRSIIVAMDGDVSSAPLDDREHADAIRFAVQVGLAAVWKSWGIEPGDCLGEGIGAIVAEHVSGRLSPEEAARFIAGRDHRRSESSLRDGITRRIADLNGVFIEFGAGPESAAAIRAAVASAPGSPIVLSSIRGGDRGGESLRWSAAALYAEGYEIDWSRVWSGGRFVRLPSYPWRRERFWLDQEAPPTPVAATAEPASAVIAEVRPTEDLIAYLRDRAADLLGVPAEQVAVDRPLMAMGLDSIVAMELKGEVDADHSMNLPLSALIEADSIRDLAERIRGLRDAAHAPAAATSPDIEPTHPPESEASPPRPSRGQRMLWYAHQLSPTGAAYHVAGAGLIRSEIDVAALRRALLRVVARHEALRSTFPAADDVPTLCLLEPGQLAEVEGLWLIAEDASDMHAAAIPIRLTELVRRPFDLERGPLFRVHLLRRSDSEHVALVVFHHIISDFLSAAVFLDELGRAYAEERDGRPGTWSMPPRFTDFVRRQEERLAVADGERLWAYWERQLAGPLPVLDLPTDEPRPRLRGDAGHTFHDVLDPALTAALASLGESRGASLYTTLLAAFQAFLARWAGQDEVIVGTPVSGRTSPGFEDAFGYFVNMLPMRASVGDDPPFDAFLARVRRTVAEGLEHQDLPFSLMLERLRVSPEPGRSPIFQVMYAHQRSQRLDERGLAPFALGVPGVGLRLHELDVESLALDRGSALFELSLMTARDGDRLRLAWEYSTELFADRTIESMADGFRALLAAVVADPGQRLSDLPVVSEEDRNRLLEWWSVGLPSTRDDSAIHRRFEREAALSPDATALVDGPDSISYGELNRLANVVARDLNRRGIGPEQVVGLYLESLRLRLVGLLGVLKAGAAYLPLDPEHPDDRLAMVSHDSGATVVLSETAMSERFASLGPETVVFLDAVVHAGEGDDPGNPDVPIEGDNLAYVIATSGTTGRPKCVMVAHRALLAVASAWEHLYDLRGATRRHLQAAPFAFDVFTGDWVRALTTGGTLVACPRRTLLDPAGLAERIESERIDFVELVPAIGEALAEHLEADAEAAPPGLPLRLLALGSDTLRSGLLRRLRRLLPGARVVNSYGLTEAAVDSLCFDPPADDDALPPDEAAVPVGHPLQGTRAYVLDHRLEPVPPGVTGELYIAGDGVARGYIGDPRRTAERFLPDPYGPPGARMYATGDRAVWRDDGVIGLIGRSDGQVKIGGVRVELAEIEAALLRHPSIKSAVAVAREDARGRKRLAAYLVPAGPDAIDVAELRRSLARHLPEAIVPSWFVTVASMPLSPNGKIDRAALPPPDEQHRLTAGWEYVAPRTEVEERLAAIAAGLLGRDRVGIHDNFYDLGIDSILGLRLVSRARQAGLELDPIRLFRTPTIAGLASGLPARGPRPVAMAAGTSPFALMPEGLDRAALERQAASIGGIEDAYPLTPVQAGLLFHSLADPEAGSYVEQFVCGLRGELDPPALRGAWHRLIARHPALRSAIHWRDRDQPYQVVHRRADSPVEYQDWQGLPDAAQEESFEALLASERRKGFDLSRPPLLRLTLIRTGPDRHRLIWSVHHIAVDGWCLAILLREVLDAYESLRRGEEPVAAPAPPFRDYVAWLRDRDEDDARAFWRTALRGVSGPTPLGFEGTGAAPGRLGQSEFGERETTLRPEVTAALQGLARARRLTLATIIQGAWALLVSRYSGLSDVLFGVTVAGRPPELPGVESMVGLFINTLPLRVAVDESAGLVPWLARLQDRLLELRRFESVPLSRIRGWSGVPPGETLFESVVTVQNLPEFEALEQRADRLGVESARFLERTHYPISVTAIPGDALRIVVAFDARRFAGAGIERVLGHLGNLLEALAEDPRRRLADLPWLPGRDGDPPVGDWGPPAVDHAPEVPDLDRLDERELDLLIDRLRGAEPASITHDPYVNGILREE